MTDMEKAEFIRCPICGNKTRDKIREDTILKNFPLFCPKCKSECLIFRTISYNRYQSARRTAAEPITHKIRFTCDYRLF